MSNRNVAEGLRRHAAERPEQPALVTPAGGGRFESISYRELDRRVDGYARGFQARGIAPGDRVLFLVKPGADFYSALFGLFRLGAIPVLMDPGMGFKALLKCIEQIKPRAVLAIPVVHIIRLLKPKPFASAEIIITAGSRWFWGGSTLRQCLQISDEPFVTEPFDGSEEGFIAFTSGSTGVPKGVSFLHEMFTAQAELLGSMYGLGPGQSTVECFAAFVIYDLLLGMTVVLPDMNMSKPATAKPQNVVDAIVKNKAQSAFASPVVWANVTRHCQRSGLTLPTLERVLTAGAPIPADMHRRFRDILSEGVELFTPYGATESLPVASIGSSEVLGETWSRTASGHGTCVGHLFDRVAVHLVKITDEPMPEWSDALLVPEGEIGEIVIEGPVVSPEYKDRPEANALSKIRKGEQILHRIGDLGYRDDAGRLWFCGRKSHALWTASGLVPAVPVEGVFNEHPKVLRTALVGLGERGDHVPLLCVELEAGEQPSDALRDEILALGEGTQWEGLLTASRVVWHPGFPVDPRHNSKIKRGDLRDWAAQTLGKQLADHGATA